MKVLLLKDVRKLGYVGDVVDVKPGYARNYLVPYHLATEPSEENIAAIAEEKKRAAADRAARFKRYQDLIDQLVDVSITIEAAANPEGTLYGSVSARDISKALHEQGHPIDADFILVDPPIRTLDNRMVTIEFTDELKTQVKVWVVREGAVGGEPEAAESETEQPVDEESPAESA